MNRRLVIASAATMLAAAILALAVGCGSGDHRSGPPPFSVAESEVKSECMTGTFVPGEVGLAMEERPPPKIWRRIEEAPQALPAERGAVKVTLRPKQPGAEEEVTLTGITFQVVDLGVRPIGAIFYRPCARRLVGPAVETDLDRRAYAKIIGSSADPAGSLRVGFHLPAHPSPIEFPFTVALRKPLNLYLLVQALDIYCDWTARISWTSDSSEGVIHVDNSGHKYRVVDGAGTLWRKPTAKGQWSNQLGSSTWIGVKR